MDRLIRDTIFSREVRRRLDNEEWCHLIGCLCSRFRGTGIERMMWQLHHYNKKAREMKKEYRRGSSGPPLNPSRYSQDQMNNQSPHLRLCCPNAHHLVTGMENSDAPEDPVNGHNSIPEDQYFPPSSSLNPSVQRRAFFAEEYKLESHNKCAFTGVVVPRTQLRTLDLHHVFGSYNTLVDEFLFETKKNIDYSRICNLPDVDDTVHAQCCFYEMILTRAVQATLHTQVWHRLEQQLEPQELIDWGFPFERVWHRDQYVWRYVDTAESIFGPDAMQLLSDASDDDGFISLGRPPKVVEAINRCNAWYNASQENSDEGMNAMDMETQADHLPENAGDGLNRLQEGKTEEGCCICHEKKDHEKLWKCQDCSNEYHLSCLGLDALPTNPDQPHCEHCGGIMSPLDIGQDDSNNGSNAAETEETFAPEIEVGENDDAENEETFAPEIEVEENEGRSQEKLWWRLGDEENVPENPSSFRLLGQGAHGRGGIMTPDILQGQSLALGFGDDDGSISRHDTDINNRLGRELRQTD